VFSSFLSRAEAHEKLSVGIERASSVPLATCTTSMLQVLTDRWFEREKGFAKYPLAAKMAAGLEMRAKGVPKLAGSLGREGSRKMYRNILIIFKYLRLITSRNTC
jgi:hypothetical protein